MNDFHKKATTTALKSMFDGNHYNICAVDKCLKLTGCIPNKKDYLALSALHCVDFSDMDKDLRNMVLMKTMQLFEEPGFDTELLSHAIETKQISSKPH